MTLDDLHLAIDCVAAALETDAGEISAEIGLILCEPSPGADSGCAT